MDATDQERRIRNSGRMAWTIAPGGFLGAVVLGVGVALLSSAWINANEPVPSSRSVARDVRLGIPKGLTLDPTSNSPAATWVERGESFAVVTWGSGSCPPVAIAMTAVGDDQIDVRFGPSPNDICMADMAATTHEFELPEGIGDGEVTINVGYTDWPDVHTLTLDQP